MSNDRVLRDLLASDQTLPHQTFFHKKTGLPENSKNAFSLHIMIVGEDLSRDLVEVLTRFQNPFTRISFNAISVIDANSSIAQIIPTLQSNLLNGVKTVIIGLDSTCCKTAFDALQFGERPFNVALTQSSVGIDLDRTFIDLRRPWLESLFVLGNQAHLTDHAFHGSDMPGFRNWRLGSLKPELAVCEPEIRASELFGISFNALKQSEAPAQTKVTSTGFTSEDACQMTYYAGRSERNQIFCLYDFAYETEYSTTNLLATLIWYFMHGLNLRPTDAWPMETYLKKLTVEQAIEEKILTFYKDENEQKWWLKSPFVDKQLTKSMPWIACDYHDYQVAANEQILTDRLLAWFELYERSKTLKDSLQANTS